MADAKKVKIGGIWYNVKDETARNEKVSKSGDTMTGALNLANATWNKVGDDCLLGDCDVAGCVGVKGNNGNTGLNFVQYNGSSAGKLTWDGTVFDLNKTLVLSKSTDASGTADNKPALIVGGTASDVHIEIDGNEIMAKTNGTSTAILYLNSDGGIVSFGGDIWSANGGMTLGNQINIVRNGTGFFVSKNNNIELGGTAPSAEERVGGLHLRDKNDRNTGYIENLITPTGQSITRIIARNFVNNANADNILDLRIGADGTREVVVTDAAVWRSALGVTPANIGAAVSSHYSKFADIPNDAGLYYVTYTSASDANAPITGTGTYWWNVLQIGANGSRVLQLASSAFGNRDALWFRVKQDSTWHGWYSVDGNHDKTFTSGTLLAKVNEYRAYCNFPCTFTKTGSASISDLPSEMSATAEFNVLLVGSKTRTSVYVNAYGGDGKTYKRDVFNNSWLIDWKQV